MVTNSPFVLHSGVSHVLISDHLTVFCIRKKKRENIRTVYRVFRDFKNYSKPNVVLLLKNYNWNPLRNSLDPNSQWDMLYKRILEMLSIMCPFKRYRQREVVKPWLTPEIYRAIRNRERSIKVFQSTGCQHYYKLACTIRNKINVMIDQAKANYFKNVLHTNSKKTKKFWRILKNFMIITLIEMSVQIL